LPQGHLEPDADKPGTKAAAVIAEVVGKCEIVQPDPAWKEGWDLADGEAEGWECARVLEYLESHLVTPREKAPEPRVETNISSGDLHEQSLAVWTAVEQVNNPPALLTSAAGLTIVDRDPFDRARRRIAKPELLRQWLTERLAFKRFSNDGVVGAKPSDVLIQNLLAFARPRLPFLRRVTEVPILAPDGRLIASEGFDERSGIYYLPHPALANLETAPDPPTPDEIKSACALIDDLTVDFPFVGECDRAHAYSFALLPIVRATIDGPTPLFRFEAPQARTGKSLLMRTLARLGCSAISDLTAPDDEDEWRKRITSAMGEAPDAFLIDNATALDSAQLAKLLTDDIWEDRRLGGNEQVRYPVRCTFGATLNNPILSREMLGRSLRIRLDAQTAHPEQRKKFRHPNLVEYARENRAALVGALVTLARAAPESDPDAPVLGGYEAFCRRMSATLKAIGIEGLLGDRGDRSSLSSSEIALFAFVEAWADRYAGKEVEIKDLLDLARDTDGLSLGRRDDDNSQRAALGKFLRKHRRYTVGNWCISDPLEGRHPRWHLIPVGRDDGRRDDDGEELEV
jgi:hypothetical protein